MGDPFDPLGPERPSQAVPPADAGRNAEPTRDADPSDAPAHPHRLLSAERLSRLDEEIEALRRSPTPTQSRRDNAQSQGERVAPLDRVNSFLDGVAFMGIFSRTRDIIAANFNDMLDKADDPSKMIRMIILEMEETLVEVRASAARTIADQKEMHRLL
jgi:phage shock protein A